MKLKVEYKVQEVLVTIVTNQSMTNDKYGYICGHTTLSFISINKVFDWLTSFYHGTNKAAKLLIVVWDWLDEL